MSANLRIEGEVTNPRSFDGAALAAADEQVADIAELVPGKAGAGVWLRALLEQVRVGADARFASLVSIDGQFRISVPLAALRERAVVVYRLGDGPLPDAKGGPLRLVIVDAPDCHGGAGYELDACANVKGLGLVRLTAEPEPEVGHRPH